jgi:hypothetical protein
MTETVALRVPHHRTPALSSRIARARPRKESGALLRRAMKVVFYTLFTTSMMLTLLWQSPVRLTIQIGASQLRETDLLLTVFLAIWLVEWLVRTQPSARLEHGPVYLLIGVLVIPIVTGLASGKGVGIVLRDCRTTLFYLAILPMLGVLRTYRDLRQFVRFMLLLGVPTLIAGYVHWWVANDTARPEAYRFGIDTADEILVWLMLLAAGVILIKRNDAGLRRLAWLYIAATLVFVFGANDIRSLYGGVLAAFVFMLSIAVVSGRRFGVRMPMRRLAITVTAFAILLSLCTAAAVELIPGTTSLILKDMRLRRLYSVLDPTLQGTVDVGDHDTNRDDRLLGATYGLKLGWRNYGFGLGYGDNNFVDLDEDRIQRLKQRNFLEGNPGNTVENLLFTHNSFGWAFGRLGLWPALAYFGIVLLLCERGRRAMLRTQSEGLRAMLMGTIATVVYMLVQGFGGGSFFDYTGQSLIPWLACLTFLIRATELAREGRSYPLGGAALAPTNTAVILDQRARRPNSRETHRAAAMDKNARPVIIRNDHPIMVDLGESAVPADGDHRDPSP